LNLYENAVNSSRSAPRIHRVSFRTAARPDPRRRRDQRLPEPGRTLEREPKPGGVIAMALERAKLKK
jgi:hypothetical protein